MSRSPYDQTASGNAEVGKLTAVTDAAGNAAFVYDDYGNAVSATRTIAGIHYVTDYAYDLAGNIQLRSCIRQGAS